MNLSGESRLSQHVKKICLLTRYPEWTIPAAAKFPTKNSPAFDYESCDPFPFRKPMSVWALRGLPDVAAMDAGSDMLRVSNTRKSR